jgi:hypothetical protein
LLPAAAALSECVDVAFFDHVALTAYRYCASSGDEARSVTPVSAVMKTVMTTVMTTVMSAVMARGGKCGGGAYECYGAHEENRYHDCRDLFHYLSSFRFNRPFGHLILQFVVA